MYVVKQKTAASLKDFIDEMATWRKCWEGYVVGWN